MKKQNKKATTAAAARKNETKKGSASGTNATGPKKQAEEPIARNSVANEQTREADNEFHGISDKEKD
jgi:hypothetical protein